MKAVKVFLSELLDALWLIMGGHSSQSGFIGSSSLAHTRNASQPYLLSLLST